MSLYPNSPARPRTVVRLVPHEISTFRKPHTYEVGVKVGPGVGREVGCGLGAEEGCGVGTAVGWVVGTVLG